MKINIEDCYFHGLAGGIPFWDEDRVIAVGLQQLRQIIQSKGIYSRRILQLDYGINYNEKVPKYNGDEYISICIKNPEDREFCCESSGLDSAFFRYVQFKIGIALNTDIINNAKFRQGEYKRLPGERQILDKIDISNFVAIVIGVNNKRNIIQEIEKILEGTNIPITDLKGNIITSIKQQEIKDIER